MGKLNVLIVEDNTDLRYLYTHALLSRFEVRTAQNGADAMSEVQRRKPDMILTDINLPLLDGIEFIRAVRRLSGCSLVPIIVISGAAQEALLEACAAGAVKALVKPVDPTLLLDELLQVFGAMNQAC
jgi:two-component system chemotaxis response regulator CheY